MCSNRQCTCLVHARTQQCFTRTRTHLMSLTMSSAGASCPSCAILLALVAVDRSGESFPISLEFTMQYFQTASSATTCRSARSIDLQLADHSLHDSAMTTVSAFDAALSVCWMLLVTAALTYVTTLSSRAPSFRSSVLVLLVVVQFYFIYQAARVPLTRSHTQVALAPSTTS